MQKGDVVQYTGASDEQIRWGSNDDPRTILVEGETYTVADVDEHTWHTKVSLEGIPGWFNSVSFEE